MAKVVLTVITSFGDETVTEREVHPHLTPDQMALAMINGANLSGLVIKKVEII